MDYLQEILNQTSDKFYDNTNQDIIIIVFLNIIIYQKILLIVDIFLKYFICYIKPSISNSDLTQCRWFFLHSFANFFICLFSLDDIKNTIKDPVNSLNPETNYYIIPVLITLSLHLYHIIAPWYYKKLRIDDIVHHVCFAFLLGILALSMKWGYVQNFIIFFLTGLPGCIDYFLLGLVKLDLINKLTEKKYNVYINNWVRGPGCVIGASWMYVSWIFGKCNIGPILTFLSIILVFINGQYYSKQIIENYTYYKTIKSIKQTVNKTED